MKVPVSVLNESTVCVDADIQKYVGALQQQVTNDFAPVWGTDAALTFVPSGTKPDPKAWLLVVLDNSDQAGALGYHDLTAQGLPLGKVFAESDVSSGCSVSVTISHELLEMLGDPGINMTAQGQDPFHPNDPSAVAFYMYEACDPCEDDSYGYQINGVTVSDFVHPSWFGGMQSIVFDQQGHITKPFDILPGGYIGIWTPSKGWTQVTGASAHGLAHRSRPPVGSRRERRIVGRARWAYSTKWA
jgi:hypothetical protein